MEELNETELELLMPNISERICVVEDIRKDVYPIMMPVVMSLCLASLLLSFFVVCSTPFIKRPMSPTIRLSLSLSAANAAFSGVVFVGTLIHSYLPYVFGICLPQCLILAVEALRLGVILVQVYHLLAVALIHYIGTLKPLQYAATLTPYCLKIIVATLWTLPILGIFIGFSSISGQGFQSKDCAENHFRLNGIYFRYVWTFFYFGPTFILILVYLHIFIILNRRGRNLVDSEHRKVLYKNMKTVKTTALIVVSFLVGWTPAVLTFLLICGDCYFQIYNLKLSMAIFSSTYILFILKVFVDTFIYALRLPEIRGALRVLCAYIASCCLESSGDFRGRRFRFSAGTTTNTRSTYFTSINSNFGSEKNKSLTKKNLTNGSKKMYATVEMKPLFEKFTRKKIFKPSFTDKV